MSCVNEIDESSVPVFSCRRSLCRSVRAAILGETGVRLAHVPPAHQEASARPRVRRLPHQEDSRPGPHFRLLLPGNHLLVLERYFHICVVSIINPILLLYELTKVHQSIINLATTAVRKSNNSVGNCLWIKIFMTTNIHHTIVLQKEVFHGGQEFKVLLLFISS